MNRFVVTFFLATMILTMGHSNSIRHRNLATKTPYLLAAKVNKKFGGEFKKLTGCDALQFIMVARHGTRYPNRAGIKAIKHFLPDLAKTISTDGSERWQRWQPLDDSIDESLANHLHAEGEMEWVAMAERYHQIFPTLLTPHYDRESYVFRSTLTQRTLKSAFYFATGLYGHLVAQRDVKYETSNDIDDRLLRFHKVCPQWMRMVKNNPDALKEKHLFETSPYFVQIVLQGLQKALGSSENITLETVDKVYAGCAFGQAWNPRGESPWCSAFTSEMLSALEYREDLEKYWKDGHGFDINFTPACLLMTDIWQRMSECSSRQKGVFYFAHSSTLLRLISYLGLYKDQSGPLTHKDYDMLRVWRTSEISPFAGHLVFVPCDCGKNKIKVALMHNERLIPLSGCPSSSSSSSSSSLLCDIEIFHELFKERLKLCDWSKICNISSMD